MIEFAPLIAGIETLIIPAIILFIFLINAVSQIAKKEKEKEKEQRNQQANPPRPQANVPRPPAARPPAPGQPGGAVAQEINSFLNRLTQQPQGQQPPARQPTMARLVEAAQSVEAQVVTLTEAESVSSHVASHLGSRELGQRLPSQLQSAASKADDKMEARLSSVFDHRLGSLRRSDDAENQSQSGPAIPPTAAVGLAAMFANPGNIRQAIIIQEILTRPTDRWS